MVASGLENNLLNISTPKGLGDIAGKSPKHPKSIPKIAKMPRFSNFGGTKNGTSGAWIKIVVFELLTKFPELGGRVYQTRAMPESKRLFCCDGFP